MQEIIISKLHELEKTENIRVLWAVESGSRAWGFASPDSDYDVRFIYVRRENDYLKLGKRRDVIELPINDMLDINGWDLDKALKLLYRSNPTLFEWLSSPIIYIDGGLRDMIAPVQEKYFSSKKALYHYLSMASGNYREYLKSDMVRAKKYFYVLRPILACKWILEKHSNPPMLFTELVESVLDPALKGEIDKLLDIKMNSPEIKLIPRVDVINAYLEDSITVIHQSLTRLPEEPTHNWEELNAIFLGCLKSQIDMTEDEKIDFVAARILREHKAAFEELAK